MTLYINIWNHVTVCKKTTGLLRMLSTKCLQIIHIQYMYKEDLTLNNLKGSVIKSNKSYLICIEDLALNNPQGLIYHKTQPNLIYMYEENLALNNPQELIYHKTKPKLLSVMSPSFVTQKYRTLFLLPFLPSVRFYLLEVPMV